MADPAASSGTTGAADRERIDRIWAGRLGAIGDTYSSSYDAERQVDGRLLSRALELAPGPGLALDVGSFFPDTPRDLARRGWTVVCADIVFDCCARARDIGAAEGLRLLAVQCDAFALPFKPGTFDLVTDLATSVVTRDAARVIDQEVAMVREGGAYVLVSNNKWTKSGERHLRRVRDERGKHTRWGYFSPLSPLDFVRIGRHHRVRLIGLDSEVRSREVTGLVRFLASAMIPALRRIVGWRIGALYSR